MLIKVLSLKRDYIAVLENAYSIGYDKKINNLWTASFKLPIDDEKNELVQHFRFVEIWETEEEKDEDYIGLFQILPKETTKNNSTREISYECTHVLRTLMGKSLFKYHQSDGNTTRANLEWLLSKQDPNEKYWVLGECDFTRYFSYSFENENLLSAIFSIPTPFEESYRWTWNTRKFPWILNLVKQETEPVCRLSEGYNLVGFTIEENPNDLFNRVYPLGSGEGVNQLDITKINNGKPYVENAESIAKYGLQEYVWADKRFTLRENLKASAEALLSKWSRPIVSWTCSAAYLYQLTGESVDKFKEGAIVRVHTEQFGTVDLRINREKRQDIGEKPGDIDLELGDIKTDLGTTATDVERRQQINELWSQGATNVIPMIFIAEADEDHPIKLPVFLDDDIVHVNTAELTISTTYFRATSKGNKSIPQTVSSSTSSSGGASVQSATSSSGGGSVQSSTSESGGGSTQSSSAGGGQTSSANGDHRHLMFIAGSGAFATPASLQMYTAAGSSAGGDGRTIGIANNDLSSGNLYTAGSSGNHSHTVSNHTHSVTIPSHTHRVSVTIPAHTHRVSIDIPAHTHEVSITIPGHTHEIIYGIFEYDNLPDKLQIKVDGKVIGTDATDITRYDIIPYLHQESDETVSRGEHTIEIKPNNLARIQVQLTLRVFIRSNLGGTF